MISFLNLKAWETTAFFHYLGINPKFGTIPLTKDDWTQQLISDKIAELNYTASAINFETGMPLEEMLLQSRHVTNALITDLYLHTIITARKYLSKNIAINISQITKYTTDMGYFELCEKNILSPEDSHVPVSGDNQTYNRERSQKPYDIIKLSDDFKKKIKERDGNSNIRSRDSKLRINMKSISYEDTEVPCCSYINSALNWIQQKNNDFPIYNTDIAYTIMARFRKFDSSYKTFYKYMQLQERTTKEERRLTRNLYKNFIQLLTTNNNAYKKIFPYDSSSKIVDKYMHNYEIERLFHFQFLPRIIFVRRIIQERYNTLDVSLQMFIDRILIECSFLPNAFSRTSFLALILEIYFGIHIKFSKVGIIKENSNKTFEAKKLTEDTLIGAEKFIRYVSRIYMPTLHRTFFYSMYDIFQDTDATRTSADMGNYEPKYHLYMQQILTTCEEQFITHYLNPSLSNEQITAETNNFLLNPKNGYINSGNDSVINRYDYGTFNANGKSETNLTGDETDFVAKFFLNAFAPEIYNKNNNFVMDYHYFAADMPDKNIPPAVIAQNCEYALAHSKYI